MNLMSIGEQPVAETATTPSATTKREKLISRLSVVMPVYNEVALVEEIVSRIRAVSDDCEIVMVDDGSTDGTPEVLKRLESLPGVRVFCQPENRGKGAALRQGFAMVTGTTVI